MFKKILIYLLCFTSTAIIAGDITKKNGFTKSKQDKANYSSQTVNIKKGLNKKFQLGKYQIMLTRVDDRQKRIHLKSTPRNRSLTVEAYDHIGNKMKPEFVGNNLSTASTSNHKYMYESMPVYIVIK